MRSLGILVGMQFVLNMSFVPHFVALFDSDNQLVDSLEWDDFRAGSQYVWDFLEKNKIGSDLDLSFIGGVSGPGGFSTLRVGGAIINALSFKFNIPVHQVRADLIARELVGSDDFLLNSFGDGVFQRQDGDLVRVKTSEVTTDKPLFVDWLPEEKQSGFSSLEMKQDIIKTVFETLQKTEPRKVFLPDYEFPAVS